MVIYIVPVTIFYQLLVPTILYPPHSTFNRLKTIQVAEALLL